MPVNQEYTPASLMRFQVSLLCLGVALEKATPAGLNEISADALVEAERLSNLIEARDLAG